MNYQNQLLHVAIILGLFRFKRNMNREREQASKEAHKKEKRIGIFLCDARSVLIVCIYNAGRLP
jgi:hypothetical protein